MSAPIYSKILKDFPINEDETAQDYTNRVWDKFPEYGCKSTVFKDISANIRNTLPKNRQVKIKRSETTLHGVTQTEKFGYVKENEIDDVSGYEPKKLTSNPYGGQWVKYEKKDTDYLAEIQSIFSSLKFDKIKPFKPTKSQKAIKVTLSDMHVGMSVNNSLFNYSYGETEFNMALDMVFNSVMEQFKSNGKFDVIFIQDLGDALDGYNNETTRGGHKLEQNMTNNQAFHIFVKGKLNLIDRIYKSNVANKVVVCDTVNCNHSGDFGFMANYAIKLACEKMYPKIEYNIFEKFIEHFFYGEHCFIQCHGKDKQYMRSGMPLKLDDKTQNYIGQYIDRMEIKSKFIHFDKGDLHQLSYQRCKRFDYRNYMSLAPPSNWVQHNFNDGYSGFSIQVIEKDKREICNVEYFIEYDNGN